MINIAAGCLSFSCGIIWSRLNTNNCFVVAQMCVPLNSTFPCVLFCCLSSCCEPCLPFILQPCDFVRTVWQRTPHFAYAGGEDDCLLMVERDPSDLLHTGCVVRRVQVQVNGRRVARDDAASVDLHEDATHDASRRCCAPCTDWNRHATLDASSATRRPGRRARLGVHASPRRVESLRRLRCRVTARNRSSGE